MKKLGIFGGRFDPIHIGHLIVAQDLLERLGIEKIIFLVSHNPPHKGVETSFEDRFRMVKLATLTNPKFDVSDIERRLNLRKSYTVLVLKELKKEHPDSRFFFIMGYDQFLKLPTWYRVEELFNLATPVVLKRITGESAEGELPYKDRVIMVHQRIIEVSSTEIRERLKEGKSIKYLVPEPVREYIEKKRLYRPPEPPSFGPKVP